MSDIVKYNNSITKHIENIIELYGNKMPNNDLILFQSVTNPKIKELGRQAVDKLRIYLTMIHRDLGIKKTDDLNIIRIIDLINKHFNFLTIDEIKLAFEYLMLGTLDKYFPKINNSDITKPIHDTSAYGNLSPQYFIKVIRAYRSYKNTILQKYEPKIQKVSFDYNLLEISINHNLIENFNKYKKTNKLDFIIPRIVFDKLKKIGLIKKHEPFTYKDFKIILNERINSKVLDQNIKQLILIDKNNCKISKYLYTPIDNYLYIKSIKALFDKLIIEKKHIKDYLK